MSLILDALNKADRQRDHKAPVPHLGSYHSEPKVHTAGVPVWAIYAVVGLLVLVVLALMLLVFKGGDNTAQRVNTQAPAMQASAAPSELLQHAGTQYTAQSVESQSPDVKSPSVKSLAVKGSGVKGSDVQSADLKGTGTQNTTSQDASPQSLLSQKAIEQDPVLSQKVASIYQRVGDQAATPRLQAETAQEPGAIANLYTEKPQAQAPRYASDNSRSPATAQKMPTAEPLLAPSQLQAMWDATQQEVSGAPSHIVPSDPYRSIPYLHQLPDSFKARIPTLSYDNHIFSPKGGAVILNGETYRAGDHLAQDLVVDAIAEEYLVLSYLQKPFRLKALSSWIQMN